MKLFVHTGIFGKKGDPQPPWKDPALSMINGIGEQAWTSLIEGKTPLEVAVLAVRLCETEPTTNAGVGSKLQKDGQARMTASISSVTESGHPLFSAITNIKNIEHPIDVALRLHERNSTDRILAGEKATVFAQKEGFPPFDPTTPERLAAWRQQTEVRSETVGAIAIDNNGNIACAASTGGVGGETPGRVGDVASPAGCYTNGIAGIVFSGDGQKIVDHGGAAYLLGIFTHGGRKAVENELLQWNDFSYGLALLPTTGETLILSNARLFNHTYKER